MKKAAPWLVAIIGIAGITYAIGLKVATDRHRYLIDNDGNYASCLPWIMNALENSRTFNTTNIRPEVRQQYADQVFESNLTFGVYTQGDRRGPKVPIPEEVCVFDYRFSDERQRAVKSPSPEPIDTPTPQTG